MNKIDNIITEAIDCFINESITSDDALDDIKGLLKAFKRNSKLSKAQLRKKRKLKKKAAKIKKGTKKWRKTKGGGKVYYDYNDYESKHRKLAKGDADSIRDTVDQKNTDIAAVSRELLPGHTKNGSQSQVRKILNGERPMTKDMASKLEKMIAAGRIAVK